MRSRVLFVIGAALGLAAAAPAPSIEVTNESQLAPAEIEQLVAGYRAWAVRVYRYLEVSEVAPIQLVFTPRAPVGLYVDEQILMPPDDDREDMEETFIHELTHHATGHDSTYFFKEGIATHVLEKLFAEDGRVPLGWPQYGARNDAWVRLYAARGQLPRLAAAMAWAAFDGSTRERDYRSWQIYTIGGSFCGWYIGRYGMAAFHAAFAAQRPPQALDVLERDWLAALATEHDPLPDPAALFPDRARYRDFARYLEHR
jgi:hypothetical protein